MSAVVSMNGETRRMELGLCQQREQQQRKNNYRRQMAEILDFTRFSANLKTAGDGT